MGNDDKNINTSVNTTEQQLREQVEKAKQELEETIKTLSLIGYGKNSSIGKGFFVFSDFEEIKFNVKSNIYMTYPNNSLHT